MRHCKQGGIEVNGAGGRRMNDSVFQFFMECVEGLTFIQNIKEKEIIS